MGTGTQPQTTTGKPAGKSALREYLETIIGAVLLAAFIMVFIARAFTVDGPSMLPTLHHGERLLIDKVTYRFQSPSRGDIVVFRYPADPGQHFIKRIIGVPGDELAVQGGNLHINGDPIHEDYVASPTMGRFGPAVVPTDHFFVMGDNRNNSEDSRDNRVGFVPRDHIVGRALWRYWPPNSIGVMQRPAALVEFEEARAQ